MSREFSTVTVVDLIGSSVEGKDGSGAGLLIVPQWDLPLASAISARDCIRFGTHSPQFRHSVEGTVERGANRALV